MTEQRPPYGDSVRVRDRAELRRWRRFAGHDSQASLAAVIGISQQNVMRVESGEWTSLGVARRIAAAVGQSTDRLFDLSWLGYAVRDGAALRALREQRGMSRPQLGEAVDLTAGALYPLETGDRRLVWRDAAEAMATVLKVPVADLFEELDTSPDPDAPLSGGAGTSRAVEDAVPA